MIHTFTSVVKTLVKEMHANVIMSVVMLHARLTRYGAHVSAENNLIELCIVDYTDYVHMGNKRSTIKSLQWKKVINF